MRTFDVAGVQRTADVSAPTTYRHLAPVVVLLHGYASTPTDIEAVTGLGKTGPRNGIVVVAPLATGTPTSWDIATGYEQDEAFVDQVIAATTASACVARHDVWIAGFSAGSAFAGIYGCRRSSLVAGLVLVSGLPPASCPDHTPRVLVVAGTADPVVSFQGGNQNVNGAVVPLDPIPISTARWAQRAGCNQTPREMKLGADVSLSTWSPCRNGGPIDLLVVQNGGHAWPGSLRPAAVGITTQTVSISCITRRLALRRNSDVAAAAHACPGEGQ